MILTVMLPPYSDATPLQLLKDMGPSAIDTELRALAPDMNGTLEQMQAFLRMIGAMLDSKRDFDLAQAYLALFLKVRQASGTVRRPL